MNHPFDQTKRATIKAVGTGVFLVSAGGLLIPKNAEADLVTALGLLNALITLLSSISALSDKSLAQQVSGSTEVARRGENSFMGADPNMLMQTYGNGGMLPLNCQGQISKDALLTVQSGDPYLHQNGNGNKVDSSINRWETREFSRVAREETGVLPIPASPPDRNVSNFERKLLDRKGIDTDIWRPEYTRNVRLNNANQSLIVARNVTTNALDKKAILV